MLELTDTLEPMLCAGVALGLDLILEFQFGVRAPSRSALFWQSGLQLCLLASCALFEEARRAVLAIWGTGFSRSAVFW